VRAERLRKSRKRFSAPSRYLALDADTDGSRSLRLEAAGVTSAVGLIEGDEVVEGRDPRARELARVLPARGRAAL
jgi:hypothetical protein